MHGFSYIFDILLSGITVGSLYALIAIGYTMVYGILRLINFAHGDIFMMAGFFMVYISATTGPVLAIPIVLLFTVLLGVFIERIAYKPLRDAPRMSIMISAIGVSYFLQNFATYLFTAQPKSYPYAEMGFLSKTVKLGEISTTLVTFITPILTVILVLALVFLIRKTKIGMAMRAVSRDFETSCLMGIKINRVISFTFAVGSALAAIGSVLYFIPRSSVYPLAGSLPGLKCFVAAVFGGIGSIPGALVGGFLIGLCETFIKGSAYSEFSDVFTFVVLILVLLVRPTGLFGEKLKEKV